MCGSEPDKGYLSQWGESWGWSVLISSNAKNQKPTNQVLEDIKNNQKKGTNHGDSRLDLMVQWTSMATNYCNRSISVETDKLIAIYGLARRLQQNFKVHYPEIQYHAGIWRCEPQAEIVYQLAWSITHTPRLGGGVYTTYVAPSFSWASLDCSTRCLDFESMCLSSNIICRVTNMNTTLVRNDAIFGRVSAGFVTIRRLVQEWFISQDQQDRALSRISV
ncbi:hypothetical protein QBC38DRAFT_184127 [Podospora fimiseda]|uniref:Uncharacterized protein n=1 Tax=Podospora fimiseda TaxID=252190 RepID=A0AAN7BQT8_9PEZI|nr:hypothetical protein QBC38DRAFT_184127 [Podospora fimiseda]